ncbi:MAG: phage minor capsid protein [Bacilli bacterium]
MDDAKLEVLIKPLIKIYDNLELELIKDIAIRLNTYTGIEGSLKWYLDKLQEIGGFNKENLALLAKYAGKSQNEVKRILKLAGYDVSKLDKYKDYIDDEQLLSNPTQMYESLAVQNIIENSIKETNSLMETIQTKAIESAKESYMKILTDAYIKVSSGVYSYDQAIKQGLKKMAKEGFIGATYKNGKRLSLESTVRRDVLTKVHQLTGDIQIEKAKQLGTNLVYVTQHFGARIRTPYTKEDFEVHADWQGKVYMLNGSSDKYENFYEKTGYGKMLGLCGVNCRHTFYPTFEWEKHPERVDQEENEKTYILSQEQRKYERKLRSLKRQREVSKILNDADELKRISIETKMFNKNYNRFLEENNLQRDYTREYIEKDLVRNESNFEMFNDNIIDKDFKNLNNEVEHLFIYNIDTKEKLLEVHQNKKSSVGGIKPIMLSIKSKDNSLLLVHNHPSNSSFSFTDIDTFNKYKSINSIIVKTDKYLYYLEKNGINKVKSKDLKKINEITRNKYIQKYGKKQETLHMINKEISKRVGWNYGRIERK